MNSAQFGGTCGKCVRVRGTDSGASGKSFLVMIVDGERGPVCPCRAARPCLQRMPACKARPQHASCLSLAPTTSPLTPTPVPTFLCRLRPLPDRLASALPALLAECPTCSRGDIDFSTTALEAITGEQRTPFPPRPAHTTAFELTWM